MWPASRWQLFKNGVRADQGQLTRGQSKIPAGGEFVLGQSSRAGVTFDVTFALEGRLAGVLPFRYVEVRQ